MILALNETRKTLLASRLHVTNTLSSENEQPCEPILPGDGVWIRSLCSADIAEMPGSFDLLFLDCEGRVLAAVPNAGPRADTAKLADAAEVLELAPGTIHQSQTEQGDRIVLDPILPDSIEDAPRGRGSSRLRSF